MNKLLRIGIIGSGPAGQAAALFATKVGAKVQIFERVPKLGPVGAGFLLQPTAFVALKRLGLFDKIDRLGSRIDTLYGHTQAGKTVLKLPYGEIDPRLYGLGLTRTAFCGTLYEELKRLEVPIQFGVNVDTIRQIGDGTVILESKGTPLSEALDLVIIAEGVSSPLRKQYLSEFILTERPYGWGTVYALVEDKEERFHKEFTLEQTFRGTEKMMGYLSCGYPTPTSTKRQVTMFWSLHKDQYQAWRSKPLSHWKEEVLSLSPAAHPILDQVNTHDDLPFATYWDVRMSRYHNKEGNIVAIGDSAHAMSPVLGQGINFALLDAQTLSTCLTTSTSVSAALDSFSTLRRPALRYYQAISFFLNPWFQSSTVPGMALTRDLLLGPATQLPILRKQMLLTQVGAKSGLFPLHKLDRSIDWEHWEA